MHRSKSEQRQARSTARVTLRRVGFALSTCSARQYVCGNRVSQDGVWSACVSVLRLRVSHWCSAEEGSLILLGQHPGSRWCRQGCKATLTRRSWRSSHAGLCRDGERHGYLVIGWHGHCCYRMFCKDDCKGPHCYRCGSLAMLMLTLLTADKLLLWTSPTSQTSMDTDTESHQWFHQWSLQLIWAITVVALRYTRVQSPRGSCVCVFLMCIFDQWLINVNKLKFTTIPFWDIFIGRS